MCGDKSMENRMHELMDALLQCDALGWTTICDTKSVTLHISIFEMSPYIATKNELKECKIIFKSTEMLEI